MVRIGDIWDRTSAVISGRFGILASIAFLTAFLPAVVRAAATLVLSPGPVLVATAIVIFVITLVVALLGQLAIIAVASDPDTTLGDGFARAGARLLPALGVSVVLWIALLLTLLPIAVIVGASGIDFAALSAGTPPSGIAAGAIGIALLYFLVWAVFMLWVTAKLFVLIPVVLEERVGLGAFGRSFALTKGLTLRLIGTIILFFIVFGVALFATQAVAGTVFRLALGAERQPLVAFLAATAAALVSAGFTIVYTTFMARTYAAVRGERDLSATFA